MSDKNKGVYTLSSDGIKELTYEDSSCIAIVNVADFRERILWVTLIKVINKNNQMIIKVTDNQKMEIYKRVSADVIKHGKSGIYVEKVGIIECDFNKVNSDINILDM